METTNIQKFLMRPEEGGAYTDEKLAALLAHAQDGKLAFHSCCCLIGIPTADHALRGESTSSATHPGLEKHYRIAEEASGAKEAEHDFFWMEKTDHERRERLIPFILAEMERREKPPEAHSGEILCEMVERICK